MEDPKNMDSSWEFNAPQFVDFSTACDDEDVDRWFDVDHENEKEDEDICNGVDVIEDAEKEIEKLEGTPKQESRRLTRSMCHTPVNEKGLPEASEESKDQTEKQKTGKLNDSLPSNLCTLSGWKKRTKSRTDQQPEGKRKSPPQLKKGLQDSKQKAVKRQNRSLEGAQKSEVDPKKLRRSVANNQNGNIKRSGSFSRLPAPNGRPMIGKAGNPALNTSTGAKRVPQRTRSVSSIPVPNSPRRSVDTKEPELKKLTMPTTPTCLKRNPVIKPAMVKNTEQKELETIAQFRQKLSKQLKQNQESYKKAVEAPGYAPAHSKSKPTQPQEFRFQTDNRLKNQQTDIQSTSPVDYVRTLRSESNKPTTHQPQSIKGITCPKPFNLTESRKRKISQSTETLNDSYHSTAEKLRAFEKQTPDRFRSKPRAGREPVTKKGSAPVMTVPVTPQLVSRTRSRPQHIPSQQDLEEQEVEEMKKNQFKAHPVNQKILQNPATGVKKVPSKPTTQVEEFNLEGLKRNQNKSIEKKEEKYEFHAQPVPKDILEGPVGLKEVRAKPVTVPHSPAFALKHRVRMPIEVPEEPEEEHVKSHPVPYVGVPFQPKLNHKTTVPQPFTFEERDREKLHRKEEKIAEILQEERQAREFRANPLPNPSADNLPTKQVKPATKLEPFHLDTDCRLNRSEERKRQIEEELHPKVQFKARPPEVLRKEPFIPEKSTKPLTDISEFSLNTEKRAYDREGFEMHKKSKEAEIEAVKRRIEKEKEEEEQMAIAKLRAEMVHKSNPVKKYTNVEVQPSDKPVTYAMSPKFETDRRLRSKVRV
ncbi:targeting protein for Xklp2 homolog isoform X2 [Mytilus californianus]|uniref:targeting protein for Xklp2 homolog isoform X2 n=1 Tax=Mytilus californianus TaxID=6549 RepID=UPI002246C92A|nr:targeting protein for Xklp2 homolog isoform X2 [Mytilus californianus]